MTDWEKPVWWRSVKNYKYQTTEDMSITLEHDFEAEGADNFVGIAGGKLFIEKGYAWDGASGPTWDDKSTMMASLVHDALYQLLRAGIIHKSRRLDADDELVRIAIEDGMWKWRAKMWRRGLKWFGAKSARRIRKEEG
jgi:hypothetical protein